MSCSRLRWSAIRQPAFVLNVHRDDGITDVWVHPARVAARIASPTRTNAPGGGRGRRSVECDLVARLADLALEQRVADWDGRPLISDGEGHVSIWRMPLCCAVSSGEPGL